MLRVRDARVFAATLAVTLCLFAACRGATAYVEFQKAFVKKYLPRGTDKAYVKLVRKSAKCLLCHQGKDRENENAYGAHLDKLLGEEDKKNRAKITEALDTVAKLHSIEGDDGSPTYGELIANGRLPVPLKEAKKEPGDE